MNEREIDKVQAALSAYTIVGELGRGAFGVVYEGRHTQLGRQVAIKQLPQAFAENEDVRERFVAEAQMVASLEHPHVVPVYDFVESGGSRFLIMERCEGSVGDRFKDEGIVTDEACAALLACLAALDFAHEKGLLHRDVKPENLLYDSKGVIKLGDFGIARDLGAATRRTATGMIIGTPAYMSPEQCRGDDLTPASDIYSVAVMGYELLTGALPFPQTDSVNGLLAHHLVTEPTPLLQTRPELPGSVGEVIDRALSKDLAIRYSTATEFASALARACVTAFGSGWLRRRRFVLHWPEIIAETERADSNSPRTGTIMVRAGDTPHVVLPDDDMADTTGQLAANPAGSGEHANAPTLPPPGAPQPAAPQPAAAPQASYPTQTPAGVDDAPGDDSSGPNWPLLGGIAAALVALVVGVIAFTGGSPESASVTVDVDRTDPTAQATETEQPPAATPEVDPTAAPTEAPQPTAIPEPTSAPPNSTGQVEQPFVMGSNDNPIMNRLPLDFDDSLVDSPWAPNPCPIYEPLVACLFAVVDATAEDDDNLSATWFTLGFTPELEPAGHHLHFYIPELIDGDENRAGTGAADGAWREWDGPWPATSFGGDSGRTLYTMDDFRSVDSNTLCVIVADAEHRAIPGSGNCAPVVSDADVDTERYQVAVDRLMGRWVGSCSDQVMAIVPEDWRWYSFNELTAEEIAREIRPTAVAETAAVFETFVDAGGAVWVEGPLVGDFIVNLSFAIIPGNFGLSDSAVEVSRTLNQLGIPTTNASRRTVGDRSLLYEVTDNGNNSESATYMQPDGGYTIAMTLTAPDIDEFSELADQIAYTMQGC